MSVFNKGINVMKVLELILKQFDMECWYWNWYWKVCIRADIERYQGVLSMLYQKWISL